MKLSFQQRFVEFLRNEDLFDDADKVIVAISGGVDSTVLARLLDKLDFRFALLHCNFSLRSEESENDELFVTELAREMRVPVFIKSFDTAAYARENKISIQMAARELRYAWFEEILVEKKYKYILTAHHKDDFVETVILNLSKGSVFNGMQGIPVKNGNIIRPMLWARKQEILDYASREGIQYREDSSNADDKYQRNLIRHNIIPVLEKVNPGVMDSIYRASVLRGQVQVWFSSHCAELKYRLFKNEIDLVTINKSELIKADANEAALFEMLREYNFTPSQVMNLARSLPTTQAFELISKTHRLVKDRDSLSILPANLSIPSPLQLAGPGEFTYGKHKVKLELLDSLKEVPDFKNKNIALFDSEKLKFPLELRLWQHGDFFFPIGMKGKKKVSDYLTDMKAGSLEKERQPVLLSGQDICWLVGKRIDERFRLEAKSTILKISIV